MDIIKMNVNIRPGDIMAINFLSPKFCFVYEVNPSSIYASLISYKCINYNSGIKITSSRRALGQSCIVNNGIRAVLIKDFLNRNDRDIFFNDYLVKRATEDENIKG